MDPALLDTLIVALPVAAALGAIWAACNWRRFRRRLGRAGLVGLPALVLTDILLPGIAILLVLAIALLALYVMPSN